MCEYTLVRTPTPMRGKGNTTKKSTQREPKSLLILQVGLEVTRHSALYNLSSRSCHFSLVIHVRRALCNLPQQPLARTYDVNSREHLHAPTTDRYAHALL